MAYVPPKFKRYFEPFVGGGALFWALHREPRAHGALLNDQNERLVRTYRALDGSVEAVIHHLREHERKHTQGGRAYYDSVRARPSAFADNAEVAAWLIFVNKVGFNGLYRVNKADEFNVPYGRYKNPLICDEANLRACAHALRRTTITSMDFEKAVYVARAGDFVYFDPPYPPASATSNFTSYTHDGFGPTDHVRLRDCARRLKDRGVHVLLSNAAVPFVADLYAKDFDIVTVMARRAINSKADKRGAVGEYIIR